MADKYLSIITNFGCHYKCPECIVRNNELKMDKTKEYSCTNGNLDYAIRKIGANWVSVSGGGDPLYHWWEHQKWWSDFFIACKEQNVKTELHTSYFRGVFDVSTILFPFDKFNRVVYHLHKPEDLSYVKRHKSEIVRVVYVVSNNMTEDIIKDIAEFVKSSPDIDELSFRQRVDPGYVTNYHLHDFLQVGHQKDWWYITQCDYNTYYHNGKLYTKYTDIFKDNEVNAS